MLPYPPRNVNIGSQGPCLLCGEQLPNTMKTIKNHIKRLHIKSRKWECDRCGLRFGVIYELKRHRENVKCEKVDLPPLTAADRQIIAHQERVDECKTMEELERVLFWGDPRGRNIRYDYKQNINRLSNEPQGYDGAIPPLGGINVGYGGMSALGSMFGPEEMPSTPESTGQDQVAREYDDEYFENVLGPLSAANELGYN